MLYFFPETLYVELSISTRINQQNDQYY